ncbi:hypothetical protein Kpol_1001p24 [Vanderwaltozyma polyspora DSM 70294]|uniref:RING-type domain-containing protein n=1 Tax=Vanderwaltozyma polyspora (strain ATCC 22028 / DSM 70294 / BCRC 21397 / CBS 2163 / NBRC 10782 / NRRL Y-8283 / UCD 57-17) TaxID=436907 RepID=A7TNR1_VANPO|nr:uncharacterized protein Kpol_1001p24 [Vanderwaltozyma polyspora DSM 70294]EDO16112.1 hypothetical protein Kpol_1001p24 [Vanderwaltozyma polyspora DSM 70294]
MDTMQVTEGSSSGLQSSSSEKNVNKLVESKSSNKNHSQNKNIKNKKFQNYKNPNGSQHHGKQKRYNGRGGKFPSKFTSSNEHLQQAGSGFVQDSLEDSIQDEIIGGNYKLRGRKTKISINHLLEFQLPEIERDSHSQPSIHKSKSEKRKNVEHIHLHGDSFINANYRLLVDSRSEYKAQSADPNCLVPAENIVRVVVPKGQNCPICLCEEPVAPRMVTCGHIFCYTCLLTFFSIVDTVKNPNTGFVKQKKYKECPLCSSIIRSHNVKDVIFEDNSENSKIDQLPKAGSNCEFLLMCKPHAFALALPAELNVDIEKIGNFPTIQMKEVSKYSRIITCNTSYSLQLFQNDIDAIQDQYAVDKALYNADNRFVNSAIDSINEKVTETLSRDDSLDDSFSDQLLMKDTNLSSRYNDSSSFFFYQTSFNSSTKFFLSPLDIKILREGFEQYSKMPLRLEMAIENIHFGDVITHDYINRYKYVSHLPLGTEIALVDLDWRNSEIIPKHVYGKFANELKQRRRKFSMKQKREDIQKKIYENRLEKEHKEFYQRENGEFYNIHETDYSVSATSQEFLGSLSELNLSRNSARKSDTSAYSNGNGNEHRQKSYTETTIWGTSIDIQVDDKRYQEEKEFQEMLLQKMQEPPKSESSNVSIESNPKSKSKSKSKAKVLLFSSGGHQNF